MNQQEKTGKRLSSKPSASKSVVAGLVLLMIVILGIPIFYSFGHSMGYSKGWEEGQFRFYYVEPPQQRYGVSDLVKTLSTEKWMRDYQGGVFDCSEMCAHLERYLENEGWHTVIAVGESPFGEGYHAWLLVETGADEYTPVEATNPGIIPEWSEYFAKYFEFDSSFETIQDAIAHSESEYDWWIN